MIIAHYIEVDKGQNIAEAQCALYEGGFCFIQGETTKETLEQCERRVSPATARNGRTRKARNKNSTQEKR